MAQTTHTPGPWLVGPTHRESEGKTWLFFSYQTHITSQNGAFTDLAVVETSDEVEGMANARLIAAAPDLLIALQLVAKWMRQCDPMNTVGAVGQILKHAEDAIAKAAGQS